jgi:hypothetical protein
VQSTGAFGSVPGAGTFRVTRSDDTVVALPNTGDALGISDDGSRVLIGSSPPSIWVSGTVLTAPAGAVFSDDLDFAVFRDANDGRIKT